MQTPDTPLPADVLAALARGRSVEAIKLLRSATGIGLKEAKLAIDQHLRGHPLAAPARAATTSASVALPAPVAEALQRGNKLEAIQLLHRHTGLALKDAANAIAAVTQGSAVRSGALSPGEVPRAGGGLWIAVIVAVCLLFAWHFLRGAA